MVFKKSQLSFFEIPLVLVLLFGLLSVTSNINFQQNPHNNFILEKENAQSLLNSIFKINSFRKIAIDENLSTQSLTEDWTPIINILNKSFLNYELSINNFTNYKIIKKCNIDSKNITQNFVVSDFVTIYDNSDYSPKVISLKICLN